MFKGTRKIFLIIILISGLMYSFGCTQKKEYTLSVNVSAETAWGKGAARFADLVNKRSNGKIRIRLLKLSGKWRIVFLC